MAAAIGLAKTATEVFLGVGTVSIDNLTFQLHYRWSVTLFIVSSVLVQTSQFFGDPVQCETAEGSVDDDVLNSFCWMYSSFDMPGQFSGPCFRRKHVSAHLYNTYYQWVPIFLAIQAGLFYIPRCLWLLIEGGLMSYIVKGLNMIHDKVFALIWLWHCFIVVMGVIRLLTRSPQLVSAEVRYFLMKFKMERYFKNNAHIKRIKHYLTNCSIGDWYVLYQMSKNLNQKFFAEYLTVLAMTIDPDPTVEVEEEEIFIPEDEQEKYRTFGNGTSRKVSLKSLHPFTSPTLNCESTDENDENEKIAEDHDGVHDTITSLAGAEMLQRYRRAMSGSGSHKDSSSSISQVQ